MVAYDKQSPDIAQGVDKAQDDPLEKGAGDQGLMFGYACDETDALMPAPIYYAHRLVEQQSLMRRTGEMPYLRPDAKSQVTMRYVDGRPVSVETVVLSTQHAPEMSEGDKMKPEFVQAVIDKIVRPVFPPEMLKDTKFLINPTGRFVVGGPQGDCGLTGRKIIVDTYGGACPHGGGAFSGKDPTKVDRSAAYACRYVAKNIRRCRLGKTVPDPGCLRHRCCQPREHYGLHGRHRRHSGRKDCRTGQRAFRPQTCRHYQDAGSAAPDLLQNGRLRSLRKRGTGVHLGTYG